jgi:hypothetical protein
MYVARTSFRRDPTGADPHTYELSLPTFTGNGTSPTRILTHPTKAMVPRIESHERNPTPANM